MGKKILKITGFLIITPVILIVLLVSGLYLSADMNQPHFSPDETPDYSLAWTDSLRSYGPNHLFLNEDGLWELTLHGEPAERGIAFGKLASDLLYYQEKVFVDQIRRFIPSDNYLRFLRYLIVIFNRNLGQHIPLEYRKEIYGISLSCTDEYNSIGTPYERQLNYHAAHDIGHTMQDYMLVGCSSFAVWQEASADSTLLIGRNFDFFMGDDFARHKMVSFYNPSGGYRFASIGWAGMTGVLSGMNETGLTVTINAAKGSVPTSAATPVSILARQILQYASTIEEAYTIADTTRTFVSESLLIGSALDGVAAVIEKSPDQTALYQPEGNRIISTNHYQSEAFRQDKRNIENINTSDSPYRYQRLEELLDRHSPVDIESTVAILRDYRGLEDVAIGLGNEKALNQFIAHHSVVFEPDSKRMWVSTSPWQNGAFICYDLDRIFNEMPLAGQYTDPENRIPADIFLQTQEYESLKIYRETAKNVRLSIEHGLPVSLQTIQVLLHSNPEYYEGYCVAAEYLLSINEKEAALSLWLEALKKEIPTQLERDKIEKRIKTVRK